MKRVTIYTDGGCRPNPGVGGWGAVILHEDETQELSGGARRTTNNQMELTAVIEALDALPEAAQITLYTDSVYVKSGITSWMKTWMKNGWRTSNRQPVKNQDLWQRLHAATQRHEINWRWVKGHAGNVHNERVDKLATEARRRIQRS